METILEQQRRYHEERERLMDAMVKEMLHKKSGVSSCRHYWLSASRLEGAYLYKQNKDAVIHRKH
jgi:hypothetical protein